MPFNLPFSVRISNTDPTDDRALTADAAAKNGLIDGGRAYDGLLTYQQDVGKLYMLDNITTSGWTAMATETYVDSLISASGGTNITNPGDTRLLTSDGTAKGIDAESNLTFNDGGGESILKLTTPSASRSYISFDFGTEVR